ncbi:esterase-like activity of phytase family protein [Hymenobacter jejuensis]|uniref:Esterase-like activity of phytase family protein n=1 Tax=Hymenobacter jejuensis TaxID=2502781 RepID=A0A5B7ZY91_9BACT|nr:esterase-like activity of phytase family protein [Hymenobacter jejuensis]QDA60171.1 esterase-like activity of phytase family protein [Hymenobacter jejuensis]
MIKFSPTAVASCLFATAALLAGCKKDGPVMHGPDKMPTHVSSLRFIGEKIVPFKQDYNNTTIGGLSSIDYRPDKDKYYIMCDDASAFQPVRYYTADIDFDQTQFTNVNFTGVTTFKRPDGSLYPNTAADRYSAIDPEGLAYDPATSHLIWSSEGIRNVTVTPAVLTDPFLYEANLDGTFVASFALPSLFKIQSTENGTRSNGSFEGVSVVPNSRYVFTANEEPVYEDGPRADFGVAGSPIRLIKYDKMTHQPVAQYAYKLDAVHAAPIPADQFRLNGVVEMVAMSETKMLVMERSFAVGATPDYVVKIYEVDLDGATDISRVNSLKTAIYTPVSKRLVLDVASTGIKRVDNLEGMTFGPKLGNGHYSLVLVSDDNFGSSQITQFLAFEVIP